MAIPRDPVTVTAIATLLALIAALAWLGDLREFALHAIIVLLIAAAIHAGLCWRLWDAHRRGARVSLAVLVGIGIVARLVMLFGTPSLSDDVFRYRWDGRVQAAGENPYAAAPADVRLEELRDNDWALINYPRIRTIYPPLAQSLFAATYILHPSVKAFQVAAALGDILVILLLAGLLRSLRAPPWRLALYALHPLPIVEFAGSGHFDAWVVAAVLAAYLAHVRGRAVISSVALAAGILLKTWPLILVPLFLRRRPRWHAGLIVGLVVAYFAVYYDPGMLQPWLDYAGRWRFNDAAFWVLAGITTSLETAKAAAAGLGMLLFLVLWRRDADPERGNYLLLLGFILLMPTIHPWYLLWALPLAAVAADLAWVAVCSLAPLAYSILVINSGTSDAWTEPVWPRFVIFGLGLLIWLAQTAVEMRPAAPDAPIQPESGSESESGDLLS
ncbi:MAG: DUF2029 domain-containing protein [Acidobacteria bacterium]|nr:DUF2029 domain-containing protein [Acidobacteriota bacterium]